MVGPADLRQDWRVSDAPQGMPLDAARSSQRDEGHLAWRLLRLDSKSPRWDLLHKGGSCRAATGLARRSVPLEFGHF